MRVAFVGHHDFRSNSGTHLFNLANELADRDVSCTVLVPGDPRTVSLAGEPRFDVAPLRHHRRVRADLVHAWTPREAVRPTVEKLVRRLDVPYLVHLEDNEHLLALHEAGMPADAILALSPSALRAEAQSRSRTSADFLAGAAGTTVVVESLLELAAPQRPAVVIWPAFETDLFHPQPPDLILRSQLGLVPGEHVVVYPGNTHALNANEVRSLYLAVVELNDEGLPVKLVRLGDDHVDFLGTASVDVERHVVRVAYVERGELPRYLALADALVQPGAPGPFSDYRFPAKIPEFLAMGKPVILPRSNIGLHLRDGADCLLLETGEPHEIAGALRRCLTDDALRQRLGAGARAFAEANFSWSRNADTLLGLYTTGMDS